MTPEEVKKHLESLTSLKAELDALLMEQEKVTSLAEKVTTSFSKAKVFTNSTSSKVEDGAIRLIELGEDIQVKQEQLADRYKSISAMIAGLPDGWEKVMLRYKYLCGYSWPTICEITNYGDTQARNIRNRAIQNICKCPTYSDGENMI